MFELFFREYGIFRMFFKWIKQNGYKLKLKLYPYVIEFDYDCYDECIKWLESNLVRNKWMSNKLVYHFFGTNVLCTFRFRNKEDAMAFKLRFK